MNQHLAGLGAATLAVLLLGASMPSQATSVEYPSDPDTTVIVAPYERSGMSGTALAENRTGLLLLGAVSVNNALYGGGSAWIEARHALEEHADLVEYQIAIDRTASGSWSGTLSGNAMARSSNGVYASAGPWADGGLGPTVLVLRLEDVAAGDVAIRVGVRGYAESCTAHVSMYSPCIDPQIWSWNYAGAVVAEATVRSITAIVHPGAGPGQGLLELDVFGYKEQGQHMADLTWTNATTASVDIVRDGIIVATTENDGAFTDDIGTRGQRSYTYQICEASRPACSNQAVADY